MSWSIARSTSTSTPCRRMSEALTSMSPSVLETSGDRLSVPLRNIALSPVKSHSSSLSAMRSTLADKEEEWDFTGLKAMFLNGTLKRSPEVSNTEGLIEVSASLMRRHGVEVEVLRAIDHDIATGVYPDMTEHGYETDEWPVIWERVKAANILVVAGPIWLGDNSSRTKQIIERLYAQSGQLNENGQYAFYGRVGGALITGNEDGVKHCTMNILYSLQHLGYVIPPQ